MNLESAQEAALERSCLHCGLDSPRGKFCCPGCERVYYLLQSSGLGSFYDKRDTSENAIPALEELPDFSYLDDEDFLKKYGSVGSDGSNQIKLYVKGVHCLACIWLLEKLPDLNADVIESKLEFQSSRLTLALKPEASVSSVAESICNLGYEPVPLDSEKVKQARKEADRDLLFRLGVAAVAAGNCMLIAVSLYQGEFSGIEHKYWLFFSYLSAFLALPAVIYSASPFYKAALGGLRLGVLHVDLPISLGILAGYLLSVYSLLAGTGQVYFDSITILVFLMLGGRVIQSNAIARSQDLLNHSEALFPISAIRLEGKSKRSVLTESLTPGMEILVATDETVPIDCELVTSSAEFDLRVLSGESEARTLSAGEEVYAGSINRSTEVQLKVRKPAGESHLVKLFEKVQADSEIRSDGSDTIDKISKYFVIVLLAVSLISFSFWYQATDLATALEVLLALLVVACPCALGISAPLIIARGVSEAAKKGIFIKRGNVFERLSAASHFFFDKTGTLTNPQLSAAKLFELDADSNWREINEAPPGLMSAIRALEHGISNPSAARLRQLAGDGDLSPIREREIDARGLRAILDEDSSQLAVGSQSYIQANFPAASAKLNEDSEQGFCLLFKGNIYRVLGEESLSPGAAELVTDLLSSGSRVEILSGDAEAAVSAVADKLNIENKGARLSAEQKESIVRESSGSSVMIGDGGNDALALKAARVGIGVSGGMEQVMQVASVFIASGSLRDVHSLKRGSSRVLKTMRGSFAFAVTYNFLAGTAAISGLISPLAAAILMPLSSLTVITIALRFQPFAPEQPQKEE